MRAAKWNESLGRQVLRSAAGEDAADSRISRSQPISRVLLRGALVSTPYGRHSSRRRVAATLEPPTRGLSEQPWIESFRPLTWCCSGWRLPRFTRSGPGVKPDRGDSSLWPCSSPSSTARAIGLLRLGVTQHPALRSPDFPLPALAFTGGQRRSGWLRTRMVARRAGAFSRLDSLAARATRRGPRVARIDGDLRVDARGRCATHLIHERVEEAASRRQRIVSPARRGTTMSSPNGYVGGTTHASRLSVMVAVLRGRP